MEQKNGLLTKICIYLLAHYLKHGRIHVRNRRNRTTGRFFLQIIAYVTQLRVVSCVIQVIFSNLTIFLSIPRLDPLFVVF